MCRYVYDDIGMCMFFFFQAEDGIRDLVRSRGLGDVYKRQDVYTNAADKKKALTIATELYNMVEKKKDLQTYATVSYTHLTLPTSDLV